MPTLVVGMCVLRPCSTMPTTSVGHAPDLVFRLGTLLNHGRRFHLIAVISDSPPAFVPSAHQTGGLIVSLIMCTERRRRGC